MLGQSIFSFETSWAFWTASLFAVTAVLIVAVRRPAIPRASLAAFALGLLMLSLAAGSLIWERPTARQVLVMVDLSPSTRTANFRDRQLLDRRVRELLRDTPFKTQFFADGVQEVTIAASRLPDLPADQTTYVPPAADAVLLFSDCRFSIPRFSPPTFVVIDPGLEDPADAAVADLEIRDADVAVSTRNSDRPRELIVNGAGRRMPTTLPIGSIVTSLPIKPGTTHISAEVSPGDAWPENDSRSTVVPPPLKLERWWVGHSNPGAGWRVMLPADLPTDPASYLTPAVIVLENLSSGDLGEAQGRRLTQYVRDLGGGLIILGGDRAYAAGGYEGTALDALSPLASYPPSPTTHWILLADSSGSMSTPVAGTTRWKWVSDALVQLLPHLPPHDLLSAGSFAESLQWWVDGKPVGDAQTIPLPPANVIPHGPTNLQPALESIARSTDGKMPVQLLVLSDFDTQIADPSQLAALLKSKNIHLHLLAIGEGSALEILRPIAIDTGGSVVTELDPTRWANSTTEMARQSGSKLLDRNPIGVTFEAEVAASPIRIDLPWNRVWLKDGATRIAEAHRDDEVFPMAARWNLGEGRVLAAAFDLPADLAEKVGRRVALPPHDPRFSVHWETGPTLRVSVDAVDQQKYLNGQPITIERTDESAPDHAERKAIPQTGPGQYELTIPAPRSACIATIRTGGEIIGQRAIAGRYAPEFEAIGNDHASMRELASRSGGEVIPPDRTTSLNIHWPPKPVSLTSPLAALGALLIAFGLVWERLR